MLSWLDDAGYWSLIKIIVPADASFINDLKADLTALRNASKKEQKSNALSQLFKSSLLATIASTEKSSDIAAGFAKSFVQAIRQIYSFTAFNDLLNNTRLRKQKPAV